MKELHYASYDFAGQINGKYNFLVMPLLHIGVIDQLRLLYAISYRPLALNI